MRPILRDGDIVPIFPINPISLSPGDLVVYRNFDKQHLHRVWWRTRGALWVKDDTASVSLQKISHADVVGSCREGGVLGRGWIGLAYSLFCSAVFFLVRKTRIRRAK